MHAPNLQDALGFFSSPKHPVRRCVVGEGRVPTHISPPLDARSPAPSAAAAATAIESAVAVVVPLHTVAAATAGKKVAVKNHISH